MAKQKIQSVRGMNDILPDEAERWEAFEEMLRDWLKSYGYRPIRTPVLEPTALFVRGVGEYTDIVEKEMFTFGDEEGSLSLRPENTAACVRAAIEHSLLYSGAQRLYYGGPMFRRERPQSLRYRQFHQFGAEALGFAGPDIDAELIVMCARLWDDMGLENVELQINSLGNADERALHKVELVSYLEGHKSLLDEDSKRRLTSNPLRVLDSKNPDLQDVIEKAPKLMEFLGEASLKHFEGVTALLREASVPYTLNQRLVRGLDYYNCTVFEWVAGDLGTQSTFCAGGRYDSLIKIIGGRDTPACGFAIGIERLMALWSQNEGGVVANPPDVYVVHQGDAAQKLAFRVAEQIRSAGFSAIFHCGSGNFKTQMKKADESKAAYAVVIGDDEVAEGVVSLKLLREGGGQVKVSVDSLTEHLADRLYGDVAGELST